MPGLRRPRPASPLRRRARVPGLLVAGPLLALLLATWLPATVSLVMATLALLAAAWLDRAVSTHRPRVTADPERAADHGI